MKKTLLLLLSLFLTKTTFAQDCGSYFSFRKGLKLELTSYDKKDKPAALIKYEVLDYKPVNGGTSFVFSTATYDPKGALLAKGESFGKCSGGNYYTDVRFISSEMIPKAANMTVDVTGDQLVYPATLTAGDKLPDASISVKSGMEGGITLMTIKANITNRQVVGPETVVTPAGTFACIKISYVLTMRFMGNRILNGVEYVAEGVGVVKSEQTDDKGRKQSSTMLTGIEK